MGHFYFVRHGETYWNVENKICGKTDIGLTENGRKQAEETGRLILQEKLHIDMILTSPLSRASDTARIISDITGIPVRTESRLIEQDFGRFESTPRDGKEFHEAKKNMADRYGDGESMLMTAHRIYSVLDEITADPETVYLIAAHNGLARIVESYFRSMTNEEFASYGIANCAVKRFDY